MEEDPIRDRTVVDCHPLGSLPEEAAVWLMRLLRRCRSGRREFVIVMTKRVMTSGRATFAGFMQYMGAIDRVEVKG